MQPPVVARRPELKGKFLLLDGHLRVDVLKDMGVAEATCLVSLDDEALTFNRDVNPLTPVQEHRMILKVIGRGICEQRIAQALNVDVASIRTKRDLLNGICPEVAALLKDKHCPINTFQALKKVKPLRQYEIAKTMSGIGNYSIAYARTLVAASAPDQLVNPGKPKAHRRVSAEEMEQIERELANLQGEIERIEETFAADHLNLVLAASYVRSLLRNAEVDRYLRNYQETLHRQFWKSAKQRRRYPRPPNSAVSAADAERPVRPPGRGGGRPRWGPGPDKRGGPRETPHCGADRARRWGWRRTRSEPPGRPS